MKKKSHLGLGLVSSPYLKPWPIFSAKPPRLFTGTPPVHLW